MMTLTIELDSVLEEELRRRAAEHGRSIEAEAGQILADILPPLRTGADLVARIQHRFAPLGGLGIQLPVRQPGRELPTFE